MGYYLNRIKGPNDIKKISPSHYDELASEIREFLIETVSKTGGHLASNLGVVELTMALHLCLNFPEDKLIWDVGHQAYVHKILTGRKDRLDTIRSFNGLSGFPCEEESDCDAFNAGHASTSIAIAAGYSRARDLQGQDYCVAAVIGDGSLSGGMVFEAINNLAPYKNSNTIIVLNDNKMSISKNVGGIATMLERARTSAKYLGFKDSVEKTLNRIPSGEKVAGGIKKTKNFIRDLITPGEMFKKMGMGYFGPFDGHNVVDMVRGIEAAKTYKGTAVVHVITRKGKGYYPAETKPSQYHGVEPFDPETGERVGDGSGRSYTEIFGEKLCSLAEKDSRVVAITAAMSCGTGLDGFSKRFPKSFFDVGIAEEFAVTFAAGLAAGGMKPFVAIYSTFLQRAYDQIIHDVCLTGKNVVFAIDRAGIVGSDGKTHQGIYDIAFLNTIPGMTVISPRDGEELKAALDFAYNFDGPVAVRYPRGCAYESYLDTKPFEYGKAELIAGGKDMGIVSLGSMFETAAEVAYRLESEADLSVSLFNARFSSPIDTRMLDSMAENRHELIVIMEEGIKSGGFGEKAESYLYEHGYKGSVLIISLPDIYLEHGKCEELKKKYGLDADSVYEKVLEQAKKSISFLKRKDNE